MSGVLSFKDEKFTFHTECENERRAAREIGLRGPAGDTWSTRSHKKARKLRQWADNSAEKELKRYFITRYSLPEQISHHSYLKPMPHQIESAKHALGCSVSYIADEAGLGKTISAILAMNTAPGKALIVCPPFLRYNWEQEIYKWSTAFDWDSHKTVAIIGRENPVLYNGGFSNFDTIICPDSLLINSRIVADLCKLKFDWLVLDEAHRFKEATAKRTQAITDRLASCSKRTILMSGTPIPNGRPIELYPLLNALCPEALGYLDREDFGKRYCGGKQKTRFKGRTAIVHRDYSGASHLDELHTQLTKTLMIRHLKADVLPDLPAKTRKFVFLDAPKSLKPYESDVLRDFSLDELMGDDKGLGAIAIYRRLAGEAKIADAAAYVENILSGTDEKLVVFGHHIEVIEQLAKRLKDFHPLIIRGGMTAREKHERVAKFQSVRKHRVIIGNIDAMGVGFTLTASFGAVIVEPSWVPGVNSQAEDRIHRISQKENVYIRYLVLRDSLDERVLRRVLEKDKNIEKVLGDNKKENTRG